MNFEARLRLTRYPLAATTVADVWAGWFGAGFNFQPELILIHVAALSFYLGGMTLNDVFDAERDRELNPGRPIPSGRISIGLAAGQGAALLAIGLVCGIAGGRWLPAVLLAAAILAYDGFLKRWAIPGALGMGLCRYLDVQMGAGFAGGVAFGPALALGAYVVAVTIVSTLEDRPGWDAARMRSWTLRLLLGIFAVDALSLLACGRPGMAAAAAALALTFPILARTMPRE